MEKVKSSYIIGFLFIVFGIMFVLSPNGTFENIVFVFGLLAIIIGGFKILYSLKSDNVFASLNITGALLSIIFGIVLIVNREIAVKVIPIFIGGYLFVSSLPTLIFLIKNNSNKALVSKALLKTLIGALMLVLPALQVAFFGIVLGAFLILSGVTMIMNAKEDEEVIYKVRVKK